MKIVKIIKANGERVNFDRTKLLGSLLKSGASESVSIKITGDIESSLYEDISTKEIYKKAFSQLRKHSRSTAARYKLKKAIMELGPSGFPFEKYIEALLRAEGFSTKLDEIVQGQCVSHEVDVIAEKDNILYMCECKFHRRQGTNSDIKVPLYIHSRFNDVLRSGQNKLGNSSKFQQGWIFTNTRFTSEAMKYGQCVGLKLISWDYPEKESIKKRIDLYGVHPVTCLTTLSAKEKKRLLQLNKVLCLELCSEPEILSKIGIGEKRIPMILQESQALCGSQNL